MELFFSFKFGKNIGRFNKVYARIGDLTNLQNQNLRLLFYNILRLETLKVHMRIHDESRALKCLECGKLFDTSQKHKEHMNTHTGKPTLTHEHIQVNQPSHMNTYTGKLT